jgi:hypothetical protein
LSRGKLREGPLRLMLGPKRFYKIHIAVMELLLLVLLGWGVAEILKIYWHAHPLW